MTSCDPHSRKVPGAAGSKRRHVEPSWIVRWSEGRLGLMPLHSDGLIQGTTTWPAAFQPMGLSGRPLCAV